MNVRIAAHGQYTPYGKAALQKHVAIKEKSKEKNIKIWVVNRKIKA